MIQTKPQWVDAAYLAYKSQTWQFREGGVCIFGTATGTYEPVSANQVKVHFPIQQATMGYTGLLTFEANGDMLTIRDAAQTEPVILNRESK